MRTRDIVKFHTKMQSIRGAVEYAETRLSIALGSENTKAKIINVRSALNALAYVEDQTRHLSNKFRSE